MKWEDVPDEWAVPARAAYQAAWNDGCPPTRSFRHALAAVAPLIRRAALEEAAGVAECGCANRALVAETAARCGPNSGARWGLCGEANCGALDAAAIRALDT
jgi:hypothetical protein